MYKKNLKWRNKMQPKASLPRGLSAFFSKLSVGQKLAAGFGAVLLILVALVAFIEYKLVGQDELQNSVIELRVPTNIAGHDLVNGVNHSLAALRGYMILGKDSFKQQRQAAWKGIDKNLAIMTNMSKNWTVPENIEKLKDLKNTFAEFRIAQQQVEDISHSADEQPAMKMLLTEAAPRATKVIKAITGMINEEKNQPATSTRKALLATFADSRGSFAMGLASIRAYLISGDKKWSDDFNQRWAVNTERLKTIQENSQILTHAQRQHFQTYISNREAFAPIPPKMFSIRGSNKWNMANYLLATEAAPRAGKALKILADMVESQNNLMASDAKALQEESSFIKLISIIATLIALTIGGIIAWFISKAITGPLIEAMSASKRIAEGDLSGEIKVSSQDETGQLLLTMQQMQQKLTSVIERDIQSIVDTAGAGDLSQRIKLDDKEGFYKKLSSSINDLVDVNERVINDTVRMFSAMASGDLTQSIKGDYQGSFNDLKRDANLTVNKLTQVIEGDIQNLVNSALNGDLSQRIDTSDKEGFYKNLSSGLNELLESSSSFVSDVGNLFASMSEGDLTKPITQEYKGDFERIKGDANETLSKLTDIMLKIREAANTVHTAADEIAQGNADLSQRTEEQASSLEETASSMEEITSTVKQSSDNSSEANQLASEAKNKAEQGGETVHEAVGAMKEILTSSNRINDIIGVIDEIAFQTNLLALNAAVEAARAGEQGRGFAVVAGEVRNLSKRSADAAKEIKDLIRDSVVKVETGSNLVNESGETLGSIVHAVDRVAGMIAEVNNAAAEQTSGIEQINQAVSQMDEMTQQNAALVEEASAASEAMSEQASSMNRLIGFFKMGDYTEITPTTAANKTPEAIQTYKPQVAEMASTGGGNAASFSNNDDWEDF